MRVTILASIAALLLSPISSPAADWPTFRGPNGTGISLEKGINKDWSNKPPAMLWKTDLSDGGYAGPSVAKGVIYIIDHKDKKDIVRAINFKTGKDVWQYAYDDTEGEKWGYSHSTPTISGGKVYTLGRTGVLNCLDAKNGKKIWSREIQSDFQGKRPSHNYTPSPFIDGNKVIVLPGGPDAAVAALDKNTGKTIWKGGGSDRSGYATPLKAIINGKAQYICFGGGSLVGVDPNNGKLLWNYEWKSLDGINACAPIVSGNTIFITSGWDHGCALLEITADGPKLIRQDKEMRANFSAPVFMDGYYYGNSEPDFTVCVDAKTGALKWKKEGFEYGPIMGVDGVVLAFEGKTGALVMIKATPDAYTELGRFTPLGGTSWVAPVISNGKMIVRNKTTLACFDLK